MAATVEQLLQQHQQLLQQRQPTGTHAEKRALVSHEMQPLNARGVRTWRSELPWKVGKAVLRKYSDLANVMKAPEAHEGRSLKWTKRRALKPS